MEVGEEKMGRGAARGRGGRKEAAAEKREKRREGSLSLSLFSSPGERSSREPSSLFTLESTPFIRIKKTDGLAAAISPHCPEIP